MKRSIAFFALMLIVSMSWAAKISDLEGKVTDEKGQPLEFVSVALLSADSTYIQGATSDENGSFVIKTPEENGILRLSYVGYQTKYVRVKDALAGTIMMNNDTKMLQEVTVKGMMPKTKLTGNSMITTIQGTVLGKSGSAKEMLEKVPGMTVKDDELEVLGKGKPIIYINGRKMQDADELKRLRSEEIESVEVITNPGARYDVTVSSVVRIKTIRHQGDGFGFDVNTGLSQDLAYGYTAPSGTLNLRYSHNNFDIFGLVNYWQFYNTNDMVNWADTYVTKNGRVKHIHEDVNTVDKWNGEGMNYNLGFNWQPAKNHSLGMRIENHQRIKANNTLLTETFLQQQYFDEQTPFYTEHSFSTQDQPQHMPYNWDGNAYYIGQFGKLNVDLNIDFVMQKYKDETTVYEVKDDNDKKQIDQTSENATKMWAGKLVLTYPVWKGNVEAGTEMSFVRRNSSNTILGYPLPSTSSKVKENNVAAFIQYNANLDKYGMFSAGVRYEHVGFDYIDKLNDDNSMKRYQDEFFPTFSWAKQWGRVQTSLAYTLKTIRPNFEALSDRVVYINSYSLIQGDSQLKNQLMQEISANVRYSWLNLFVAYEKRENTLTQWTTVYNDNGVILVKNSNLPEPTRNLAAFLSANPTFGVYSPNWTIGAQKFWYKMTLDDPREATGTRELNCNRPIFFFDLNNAFRFKHSWQIEANMNINTKGQIAQTSMQSASYNLRFALQKCWLKNDALCARVSVNNVLRRNVQDIEIDCGPNITGQKTKRGSRLEFSLRYTFNASKSKYKGTGAGKAEQERLAK